MDPHSPPIGYGGFGRSLYFLQDCQILPFLSEKKRRQLPEEAFHMKRKVIVWAFIVFPLQAFESIFSERNRQPLWFDKPQSLFLPAHHLDLVFNDHFPLFGKNVVRRRFSLTSSFLTAWPVQISDDKLESQQTLSLLPIGELLPQSEYMSLVFAFPLIWSNRERQSFENQVSQSFLSRGIWISTAFHVKDLGLSLGLGVQAQFSLHQEASEDQFGSATFPQLVLPAAESREASFSYRTVLSWVGKDFWLPQVSMGVNQVPTYCQNLRWWSSLGEKEKLVCGTPHRQERGEEVILSVIPADPFVTFSLTPRFPLFSRVFNLKLEGQCHHLPIQTLSTLYFDPHYHISENFSFSFLLYGGHPFSGESWSLGFGVKEQKFFATFSWPFSFFSVALDWGVLTRREITTVERPLPSLAQSYFVGFSLSAFE